MKTSDNSAVVHGDEQCRDGHYRAKLDPRTGALPAMELDPNDSASVQAQDPSDLGNLGIGHASEEAAGIPAICCPARSLTCSFHGSEQFHRDRIQQCRVNMWRV
jgi:hypothetical protein